MLKSTSLCRRQTRLNAYICSHSPSRRYPIPPPVFPASSSFSHGATAHKSSHPKLANAAALKIRCVPSGEGSAAALVVGQGDRRAAMILVRAVCELGLRAVGEQEKRMIENIHYGSNKVRTSLDLWPLGLLIHEPTVRVARRRHITYQTTGGTPPGVASTWRVVRVESVRR